jgi:hypothetical protein
MTQRLLNLAHINKNCKTKKLKTKLRGSSPQANYTDRRVVSARDPHGR